MKKFVSVLLSLLLMLGVVPSGLVASAQSASEIVPTAGTLISKGVQYTQKGATYVYEKSSEAAYTAYTEALISAGYTKYSENAIETNAGSINYNGAYNRFSVYLKGEEMVHVAYFTNKKLHITIQNPVDELPATTSPTYQKVCDPVLIQGHIDEDSTNVGMCYVFRLSDGSFIIIDGGDENTDSFVQADKNYNLLRKYQPSGKINIAAWIFTHNHNDHINAFVSFIEKYSTQAEIGQLIYNFPSDEDTAASKAAMAEALEEGGYIDRFRKAVATYIPEVKVSTPYSGHKYLFADAEVEIYATPTDIFPVTCATVKEFNTSSIVFKVKIAGQEILFFGDSSDYAMNVYYPCYGTALSADIVQVVHHGITFGKGEMYEAVGASVALWPAGQWSTYTRVWDEVQNQALMRAPKTKEVILSYYGDRELALPYTPPKTDKAVFTKPDGSRVEGLLEDITAEADGDIFNEDLVPWGTTTKNAENKYYRLSDGGIRGSWITTSPTNKEVNNSENSVYVYANGAYLYATLPRLKPNTRYMLSFDYKSQSTTVTSIFKAYGISAINAQTPDITNNVFQSNVQDDCEGTEVFGTGWNHVETTFKSGEYADTEYVLSFMTSMQNTYKAYIDNIKIIEIKEPFRGDLFQDFEGYTKTNKEYYGGVSLVADSDDAENTLMQYDGTTATNTSSAQNRIVLNPTNSDITLGTYYTPGEKFNLSFKYKVTTEEDVNFYLRSGKSKTNASTISSYNTITYLSNTLSKGSDDGWTNFTATYTIPTSVKISGVSTPVDSSILDTEKSILMLIGGSGTVLIDDVMVYRVTDIKVTGDSKYIEWAEDTFEYATATRYSPTKARVGNVYSFSLGGTVAEVTYGDEVLVPDENGIYSFKVETGKVLNIPDLGTVKLNTSLDDDVTEDTIKVLGIGNSYTNDATAMLPEIALAEGKDLRVGQATIGGSTLEKHYTNLAENNAAYTFQYNNKGEGTYTKLSEKVTLSEALYAADWDYVTIQQASPASSRDYETFFEPYLETILDAIKEYAPNAQIMVHETWAYSEVKSQHFGANTLEKESYSQIDMYEDIVANYKQLAADVCEIAEQSKCKIIPSGTAFRIARSQLHNAMLNRDNNPGHANFLGRLIGACAYYRAIIGESPSKFKPTTSSLFGSSSYMKYPTSMPYDHDGDSSTTKIEDKVILTAEQVKAYIPLCIDAVDEAFGYKESNTEIAIPDAAKTVKAKNGGVSIRLKSETKGQALRFKSSVPVAERGKAYDDGYKLVEYGSLVILSDVLNNAALVHDGKYGANEKAPVKAIAYNVADNTDIIFGDDGTNLVFTVAVNNISIANYGMDITVRAYAVYKNETTGDEYYIYSDNTQTGSIFSVMETIETTYNAYVEDNSSLPEGMEADKLKEDYDALIANASTEAKTAFADWKTN